MHSGQEVSDNVTIDENNNNLNNNINHNNNLYKRKLDHSVGINKRQKTSPTQNQIEFQPLRSLPLHNDDDDTNFLEFFEENSTQKLTDFFINNDTTIKLIVDNREHFRNNSTEASSSQRLCDIMIKEGFEALSRTLSVGDFLWIATSKNSNNLAYSDNEFVANFIIERKKIRDLFESILDGRYHV